MGKFESRGLAKRGVWGGAGWKGLILRLCVLGVPAVARWVKNPAAAAEITTAAWIQSLAQELPYTVRTAIKKKKRRRSLCAYKAQNIPKISLGVASLFEMVWGKLMEFIEASKPSPHSCPHQNWEQNNCFV